MRIHSCEVMMESNGMLYLECYSGISGDMAVAALLDLGADRGVLDRALDSISHLGFRADVGRVSRAGLDACDFRVTVSQGHRDHDHGAKCPCGNGDMHREHDHRRLRDILRIIEDVDMSDRAKDIAARVFRILADAESKVHGVGVEEVHFHEVGAVDSIVDIISVAVCIDVLGVEDVVVSDLYEGKALVRCQHGVLPVPVPAVLKIATDQGLHLHIMDADGEHVTPTGAAIAAAVRTRDRLPDSFSVERVGMGAGKRETEGSGILRAMIIVDEAMDRPSD